MRKTVQYVTLLVTCLATVSCNPTVIDPVNPATMASLQPPVDVVVPQALTPFYEIIERASVEHGVDPHLVAAVIQVESKFNPRARSRRGALGLMQLMPRTAKDLGVRNRLDPEDNVRGGTKYLQRLLRLFKGNTRLALAAYNAGPSRVLRCHGIPNIKETKQYVVRVLEAHQEFKNKTTAII